MLTPVTFAQQSKPVVAADISRVADTAHLEFKGLRNWRYDVQKSGEKKIILSVPPLDLPSIAKLQSFTDPLVSSITVDKNGADGNYAVTFNLAQSDVETFDYLTDDPSRLIVDFYRKPNPEAKKPQETAKSDAAKPAAKAKSTKPTEKAVKVGDYKQQPKPERAPAGDEFLSVETAKNEPGNVALKFGVFDGGDENYDRFRIKDYEIREESIIASRHSIYLPFPMLKMNVSELDKLMQLQP